MDDDATADGPGRRRAPTVLRFLALTALAGLALPTAAWLVERVSDRAENWIFPVQLVLVSLVAVGYELWRSRRRRARTRWVGGLAATAGAVVLADAVWLLAIAG